jgi:8-oxo-dGTP pyrophosphatase MutT (NUDIX family)
MTTFASASLIFYDQQMGYLFCNEYRGNKLQLHPIGGKYEQSKDVDIDSTAVREFIEETPIYSTANFKSFFDGKKELLTNYLLYTLKNPECTSIHDTNVSRNGSVCHRFFIVHLHDLDPEFQEMILSLHEISFEHESIRGFSWVHNLRTCRQPFSFLTICLKNILNS